MPEKSAQLHKTVIVDRKPPTKPLKLLSMNQPRIDFTSMPNTNKQDKQQKTEKKNNANRKNKTKTKNYTNKERWNKKSYLIRAVLKSCPKRERGETKENQGGGEGVFIEGWRL